MDSTTLRYIVFLIDSKIKDHDGKIFCSYDEARAYVAESISDNYADKAVIGMFRMSNDREMLITKVETIGFQGDKRHVNQLQLFAPR